MIALTYLAAPSFSGSTLLTFLLASHRRVATIGELKWGPIDLETYRCSCGELLRECAFWRQVGAGVRERGLPFDLNRPMTDFRCRTKPLADRVMRARIRGPAFEALRTAAARALPSVRHVRPLVRDVNRAMIELICSALDADAFVDGSKDPVRFKHLSETGDYDMRCLHLVRDARAVVFSAGKNQAVPVAAAARDWRRTHEQIERLAGKLQPTRYFRLRYEDLCADPRGVMRRVFEFMRLDPNGAPEDFSIRGHHILGNRMRLNFDNRIRVDETWREAQRKEDRRNVELECGAKNAEYGYTSADSRRNGR
ncbi:MAG: sulfotransferase [Phycisphaerae bacterium]